MKVFLLIPPYASVYLGKSDLENNRRLGVNLSSPSLGIAYIAGFLKSKGIDVRLIDVTFFEKGWMGILRKIKEDKPGIIGITATTPQIPIVKKMAREIKGVDRDIKVVIGGYHASALPRETLSEESFDIVVVGEGEYPMLKIAQGEDLSNIQGLYYKDKNGNIYITSSQPLIQDLDEMPMPLYDDLKIERYGRFTIGQAMLVISARGCPFDCSFCASRVINHRKYRLRSAYKFVDELQYLNSKYKVNNFFFADECFALDRRHAVEICEEIIRRNLKIGWTCQIRVDCCDFEMLRIMKRAGCKSIEIGIESGDAYVLKMANKMITLDQVKKAVELLNKFKIKITAYFLLGLPYETPESAKQTIELSKRLNIDYAQFSIFVPLPGSKAWNLVKEGKVLRPLTDNWEDFLRQPDPIIESDNLSKEVLRKLYKKALFEYYFRLKFILRIFKNIKTLNELKNTLNLTILFFRMFVFRRV